VEVGFGDRIGLIDGEGGAGILERIGFAIRARCAGRVEIDRTEGAA
jgi:hypothetical protein